MAEASRYVNIFAKVGKTLLGVGAVTMAGFGGHYAYTVVAPMIYPMEKYTGIKLEELFKKLEAAEGSNSLLKKHLTRKIFNQLKDEKTNLDGTLYEVIKSGVENPDASVGVYAPDAESYKLFAPLFNPIIQEYHGFNPKTQHQPAVDLGEGRENEFEELDPTGEFIKSTRIRCGRALKGYPFNPLLTGDDYQIMQAKVKLGLGAMEGDLKGKYYPLEGMSPDVQKQLIDDHFLFKEGDRHLQAAKACNYWPKGRGIYHNESKTFLVWVNEEDHLRIISMQEGSKVGEVLERLNRAIRSLEKQLTFARDDRLGWLTFCPTNLGSTVRASVHIKLPKLAAKKDFKEICEKLNLQVRGTHGEHSQSVDGIYDVSNKARLGLSEYEAVKQMYDGVKKLIEMERDEVKQGRRGENKSKEEIKES